jgi:hypothetical protein
MQNAFIESFNGRLRDELLKETLFASLAQARVVLGTTLATWMEDAVRVRLQLPSAQTVKPSSQGELKGGGIWVDVKGRIRVRDG